MRVWAVSLKTVRSIAGITHSISYQLQSGRRILIFSSPYLLASKIEAFTGRGGDNFYFSADIEDIVAVLDGRSSLFEEVQQADAEVKAFLSRWFRAKFENLCSIGPAFLSPVARNSGRASLLLQSIEEQRSRTSQLNYNSCYKAATALVPKIDTKAA